MPMFSRVRSLVLPSLALAVAALLTSTASRAAGLSGTYTSPLGTVTVAEKDGMVTAKIVDAKKNVCGFPKGKVIFEGSRLDDSVVGTLHACRTPSDTCMGFVDGAAMLLITRGGAVMSGAAHLEAGNCPTPLNGDSVVFKKAGGGAAAAKKPDGGVKGTPRQRAEALATEAKKLLEENDANAEAARAKLQEAVQIDPTYAEGYVGIGVSYYTRERYDEAIENYKKAIEANPAIGDAYYNMACVYALKNDQAQALRYLRIALLNGYVQLNTLDQDPDLKNLQGNETFEKLKKGVTD